MPLQYLFWGLYFFALFVCGFLYYGPDPTWGRRFGGLVAIWVLIGFLGYRVFGSAIK
jgi:hypothetical protein